MVRRTTLVMAAAALVPVLLGAQDLSQMCKNFTIPPIGSWASYKTTGGYDDGATTRLAIVGSERHGDSTFYWLEVKQEGGKRTNGPTIIQSLIGGSFSHFSIHGAVMKEGPRPAMRAPDAMIAMMAPHMQQGAGDAIAKGCREATSLGVETVTVPAGSFSAVHFRGKDGGEGWVTRGLPFALVKAVEKSGSTMVLTAKGSGAKSSITETPQTMDLQSMMGQGKH